MPRLKPGTMVALDSRSTESVVFSEQGQPNLQSCPEPSKAKYAVIWKAWEYVWASLWLEENAYEMGVISMRFLDAKSWSCRKEDRR